MGRDRGWGGIPPTPHPHLNSRAEPDERARAPLRRKQRSEVQARGKRAQRYEAVRALEARAWEGAAPRLSSPGVLLVGDVGKDRAEHDSERRVRGCIARRL